MAKIHFRFFLVVVVCIASVSALAAGSVRYKWRDVEGNLHYTDSLPDNANVIGYDVINSQGILVKRVAPALTAEQKEEAKVEAAAERSAQADAERQAREDQQLLAANPTEADLLNTQQQQIEMIDLQIKSLQTVLQSLERNLTDLLGRAAELERANSSVPAKLTSQIADVRGKIDHQHELLERQQAGKEKATNGFHAELERYRALREKYKQR
ncbi:MAG TPA: DUF4124 domain-containing protein [Dokdonella sp.]|uniref:DUF4124 domain-containing protein n=1 Tax=Dokdonella sp. TaxID=2291710 RepID=UPI002D7ED45B|nr:DUF4124 domain-containing protein [Dokdonella sp.]HET9033185.1 DUF4124 domain-containing protein [Dokdonella sp.]